MKDRAEEGKRRRRGERGQGKIITDAAGNSGRIGAAGGSGTASGSSGGIDYYCRCKEYQLCRK